MGFCFCSDLLFIGGGDREPQSFQSPGAPPAKNGSQSSSARCAGVLPYSSSTAMQSMARVVPSSNRASTRLVSILKRQESSLFMVNLISISNGVCSDVLNPAIEPVVDLSIGLCFARLHIFAHLNSWITVAKHYTVCK